MEQKIDKLIEMVATVMEDMTIMKEDIKEVKQRLGEVEKSLDYQKHLVSTHDEKLYHLTKENNN